MRHGQCDLVWLRRRVAGGVLAAVFVAGMPALAQTAKTSAPTARTEEAKAAAGAQTGAGEQALDPAAVSFQDVLASPDDAGVNFAYARRLIAEGRLGLAAATLERILIVNPDLNNVRLLYAVVLYRLDNLDEAYNELQLLLGRELSSAMQAEAGRYVALIEQRRQRLTRTATVSAGLHYDSNRNAAPGGGDFLVLGAPVQGTVRQNDDFGRTLIGSVEVRYDTGLQRTQEVFGRATLLVDDQVEVDNLDVRATVLEAGATHKAGFADFFPRLGFSFIELDWREYLTEVSLGLRAERRLLDPKFIGFADIGLADEKFSNSNTVPLATEQDGRAATMQLGGRYNLTAATRLSGYYQFKDKQADVKFEEYRSHGIAGEIVQLLPRSSFVIVDASLDYQYYGSIDPFVTNNERQDKDYTIGVTYGIPLLEVVRLGDPAATMPAVFRDLQLTLGVTYLRSESNIPNYDYQNWRAQGMLTRRFRF